MQQLYLKISGSVQGVSFRYYTKEAADTLALSGWVKNLADGTLEILAQGSRENLEKFLEWCQGGPTSAQIEKLDKEWQKPEKKFDSFEIRY